MPIESDFNTIASLNSSYPTGTDFRKDGDNHIRGIKLAVKQTFPNINAPVTSSDEDLNYIAGIAADPIAFGGATIPPGIICMWSGLNANIPSGWALCNGTAGTPDLTDRFILGTVLDDKAAVGSSHIVGSVTPNADAAVSTAANHSHTAGGTALTINQIPNHGHQFYHNSVDQASTESGATGGLVTSDNGGGGAIANAFSGIPTTAAGQQIGGMGGGGATHTHTVSSAGQHSHTVDTRGKYFKLAFIMKTA